MEMIPESFPKAPDELKALNESEYRRSCWLYHCDLLKREENYATRWGEACPPTPADWYPLKAG